MKTFRIIVCLAVTLTLSSASAFDKGGDAQRGLKVWSETCSKCHNSPTPDELRDYEWKTVLTHMRIRVGLTGQDTRDIYQYFLSY